VHGDLDQVRLSLAGGGPKNQVAKCAWGCLFFSQPFPPPQARCELYCALVPTCQRENIQERVVGLKATNLGADADAEERGELLCAISMLRWEGESYDGNFAHPVLDIGAPSSAHVDVKHRYARIVGWRSVLAGRGYVR